MSIQQGTQEGRNTRQVQTRLTVATLERLAKKAARLEVSVYELTSKVLTDYALNQNGEDHAEIDID